MEKAEAVGRARLVSNDITCAVPPPPQQLRCAPLPPPQQLRCASPHPHPRPAATHHVRPGDRRPQLLVRLLRRLLPKLGLATGACAQKRGHALLSTTKRGITKGDRESAQGWVWLLRALLKQTRCLTPPRRERAPRQAPRAPTKAAREVGAYLQLVHGLVALQRLSVSVDRPKLHALRPAARAPRSARTPV